MPDEALLPEARASAIARMSDAQEVDILVVDGGIVGAGAALDAVTRGLSTAIVEARDWASGTSSQSSKLIHGGLRYLEMLDFALVREALHERGLLLQRIAPHLIRPVQFLYPLRHRVFERLYVAAGMMLYDTMGVSAGHTRGLPRHRHLTRRAALRAAPALRRSALVGGIQYWDAEVDDARYTMTVVRTAASYGALAASRVKVIGFDRQGAAVTGARLVDTETGRQFRVRAREIINATGVWTGDAHRLAGTRGQVQVRASKGVHLVVPADRLDSSTGLILRTEESVLFVIPWGRHWIIGTTDTDWPLDGAHPVARPGDVDYLLDHLNAVLATPICQADIEGAYAGLRPLLSGESDSTSRLSRRHVVSHPVAGLVVIAGGRYTTYRVMAADAVDEATRRFGARVAPSCTDRVPLTGAEGYQALWNQRHRLAAAAGQHVARIEHLLGRYGSLTPDLLHLLSEDPSLAEPLPGGEDYLAAEVVYAVTHEGGSPPGRRTCPPHQDRHRVAGPGRSRGTDCRRADGGAAGLG